MVTPSKSSKAVERDDLKLLSSNSEGKDLITRMRTYNNTKCCIGLFFIIALGLLFLILGVTVFKTKPPVTTVNSIALSGLKFSFDTTRLRMILNAAVNMSVSVKNPNRAGFRYTDSTAFLRYRGDDVGEVPIPAGMIRPHDKITLNLTLTLMADRIFSSSTTLYSDAISGAIALQTYMRIAGKVFFNIRVVTYTTCDLEIDLAKRTLSNQKCHFRTQL